MRMTTGQNMAVQPKQEGMPDMAKMMKYMIYFSPLLMLVFFNNYASGLSLYYFVSNLISIAIMLLIKNFIIDEAKVLAKIQVSKAKPIKQNRFQGIIPSPPQHCYHHPHKRRHNQDFVFLLPLLIAT